MAYLSTDLQVRDVFRSPATARLTRADLELRSADIRRFIVELAHRYDDLPFHLGGSLSCVEILAVLLGDTMRLGTGDVAWEERDRLVLSKGHASLALWPALAQVGLLSREDCERGLFGKGAVIGRQPKRDVTRGIELSGGSLGMGLGYACGLALAARRRGLGSRVFCVMGDGECDEGSVWEAASFAGHNRLGSLVVVVDANGLQLDGTTAEVLDSGPLTDKFAAFGFDTFVVDGHDVEALRETLAMCGERPRAVVAQTVKGKGLSFAENEVSWHDRQLDDEGYRRALAEIDAARAAACEGADADGDE